MPDIELTTSVTADRLRFGDEPETDVRFHGSRGRETFSGADRTNLPEPVEPGTDYHDVHVDYRLATALRPGQLPETEPDLEPKTGPDDAGRRREEAAEETTEEAAEAGPARRRPRK